MLLFCEQCGNGGAKLCLLPKLLDLFLYNDVLEKQDEFEATQICPNLQAIYDRVPGTKYMIVDEDGYTAFTCTEKRQWKQSRTDTP